MYMQLGYRHVLDLEQRSGVIARASGTACSIVRRLSVPRPMQEDASRVSMRASRPPAKSNSPKHSPIGGGGGSPLGRQDSNRTAGTGGGGSGSSSSFIDSTYPSADDVTLLTLDSLPPNMQVL
jgi:hypothetical protein